MLPIDLVDKLLKELPKNAEIWEWQEFKFVVRMSDDELKKQIENWLK